MTCSFLAGFGIRKTFQVGRAGAVSARRLISASRQDDGRAYLGRLQDGIAANIETKNNCKAMVTCLDWQSRNRPG